MATLPAHTTVDCILLIPRIQSSIRQATATFRLRPGPEPGPGLSLAMKRKNDLRASLRCGPTQLSSTLG